MELESIREQIDNIDDKIVELFIKRMDCSMAVAEYKRQNNKAVFDKGREREVVARLTQNQTFENAGYINTLYNTIFEISRALQSQTISNDSNLSERIKVAKQKTPEFFPEFAKVACQGVEGAYSAFACDKLFPRAKISFSERFADVFEKVSSSQSEYGILPLENSLHGSVGEVYDLLEKYKNKVHIVRTVKVPIHHVIVAKKGTKLSDVKDIYSHSQAIGQCSAFLEKNSHINVNVSKNTAVSAKLVSESQRNDVAAICSEECAELYGLSIIERNVQNNDNNHTRFICISKNLEIYPGSTKVAIMFTVPHRPGGLYHILARFNVLGISLTKLESRPIEGRDFEFMFYAEIECNGISKELMSFLCELDSRPEEFVFLGNYNEV